MCAFLSDHADTCQEQRSAFSGSQGQLRVFLDAKAAFDQDLKEGLLLFFSGI